HKRLTAQGTAVRLEEFAAETPTDRRPVQGEARAAQAVARPGGGYRPRTAAGLAQLGRQREPQAPVTLPTRHRLWRAAARAELQRLLRSAVGTHAACLGRAPPRSEP